MTPRDPPRSAWPKIYKNCGRNLQLALLAVLFFALAGLPTAANATSSARRVDSGVSDYLIDISFSENRGFAVGENGRIIASIDGGKTWQAQDSGVGGFLRGVFFSSAVRGTAVGSPAGPPGAERSQATILGTEDGGRHWRPQNAPEGCPAPAIPQFTQGPLPNIPPDLYAVWFRGPQTGIAVGDHGAILSTPDGGVTWACNTMPFATTLWDVAFAGETSGFTVGIGLAPPPATVLGTKDGGKTWAPRQTGIQGDFLGVATSSANRAFIVGGGGRILETADGGDSWQVRRTGTGEGLVSIALNSGNLGVAVGSAPSQAGAQAAAILTTRDGGKSWKSESLDGVAALQSVSFAGDQTAFAVGPRGAMVRIDFSGTQGPSALNPGLANYLWLGGLAAVLVAATGAFWRFRRSA